VDNPFFSWCSAEGMERAVVENFEALTVQHIIPPLLLNFLSCQTRQLQEPIIHRNSEKSTHELWRERFPNFSPCFFSLVSKCHDILHQGWLSSPICHLFVDDSSSWWFNSEDASKWKAGYSYLKPDV
jgi:hypothetical protein